MLIELPTVWVVALNIAGWPIIQLSLALLFMRLPARWFDAPLSPAASDAEIYDRLFAIRRWKDRLPDGARWLGGGFAKASLASRDPKYLRQFVRETRRGETCHWIAMAAAIVFVLWNPPWAIAVMFAYGVAGNLPCILAQRYNRARLTRLLSRSHHNPQCAP